jgi:hypothetical protein
MCCSTSRSWMRSHGPSGIGPATTSSSRTSSCGLPSCSNHRVSRSTATTCPSGPTWVASQRAIEPPPVPISRQRAPGFTPTRVRWPSEIESRVRSSPSKRAPVSGDMLFIKYGDSDTATTSNVGLAHLAVTRFPIVRTRSLPALRITCSLLRRGQAPAWANKINCESDGAGHHEYGAQSSRHGSCDVVAHPLHESGAEQVGRAQRSR